MGVVGWLMMVAHIALFLIVRKRLAKRKRILEKENAELRRDLIKSESNAKYFLNKYNELTTEVANNNEA